MNKYTFFKFVPQILEIFNKVFCKFSLKFQSFPFTIAYNIWLNSEAFKSLCKSCVQEFLCCLYKLKNYVIWPDLFRFISIRCIFRRFYRYLKFQARERQPRNKWNSCRNIQILCWLHKNPNFVCPDTRLLCSNRVNTTMKITGEILFPYLLKQNNRFRMLYLFCEILSISIKSLSVILCIFVFTLTKIIQLYGWETV